MSQITTAWNNIFAKHGKVFTEPHEDIPRIIQLLKDKGAVTVLDLGCGSGRHVVCLAKSGFSVFGLDNSIEGLSLTEHWLADEKLHAELWLQNMTASFSCKDAFFDAVVSVQVIHHANIKAIRKVVGEISRVLKRGGFLFVTVPQVKNQGAQYHEIETNTCIPLDGLERGLPHHFFTLDELKDVFKGYDVIDIHIDSKDHYCLLAFKE